MDVQFVLYIEGRAVEEEKEEIFIDCRTEDAIFGWVSLACMIRDMIFLPWKYNGALRLVRLIERGCWVIGTEGREGGVGGIYRLEKGRK